MLLPAKQPALEWLVVIVRNGCNWSVWRMACQLVGSFDCGMGQASATEGECRDEPGSGE